MKDKYLPIGTVVLLKGATKRLMINGYCSSQPNDDTVYDYVGCLFPEGNIVGDEVALFNHDQIGEISHMGLVDDEFNTLDKNIKDFMNSNIVENTPSSNEIENLPPFTPENINNILNQINSQGDALKPLSEPSAFDEESLKKPVFTLPSLTDDDKEDKDRKKESKVGFNKKHIMEEETSYPEYESDGQPVLQLQPIFPDGGSTDNDSTDGGNAVLNIIPSELSRL